MGKMLVFLIAAVIGWFLFKGIFQKPPAPRKPDSARDVPEKMVRCDLCGVHMPESESKLVDGKCTCRVPDNCAHRNAG
ncbi:MAG: PP0621 family protein [Betaproteobacteria bacterium]